MKEQLTFEDVQNAHKRLEEARKEFGRVTAKFSIQANRERIAKQRRQRKMVRLDKALNAPRAVIDKIKAAAALRAKLENPKLRFRRPKVKETESKLPFRPEPSPASKASSPNPPPKAAASGGRLARLQDS